MIPRFTPPVLGSRGGRVEDSPNPLGEKAWLLEIRPPPVQYPIAEGQQLGVAVFLARESASEFGPVRTVEVLAETIAFPDHPELTPQEAHPGDAIAVGVEYVRLVSGVGSP